MTSLTTNVDDVVYYARIIPSCDIFDVVELRVRSVYDSYFVGIEKRSKHSFIFNYSCIGISVFYNRMECLDRVKDEEEKYSKLKKMSKVDDNET